MKAQELVKLIDKLVERKLNLKLRQLIKEEVSSQVNATMGKMLIEALSSNKNNIANIENTRTDYMGKEIPNVSPINTNNPKLNSVLAETARHFKPLKKNVGGSLAELLDGGFDKIGNSNETIYKEAEKIKLPEPVIDNSNEGFLKQIVSEGTTTGQQQSILGTNAVPDVLKSVFNRNFRDVMKKMDEQKKTGSQGLINPNMVLSG